MGDFLVGRPKRAGHSAETFMSSLISMERSSVGTDGRYMPGGTLMQNAERDVIALTCRDVSKQFPIQESANVWRAMFGLAVRGQTFTALQDISLVVPKGKIVGILGHNGAGKSTLLRVLGSVYQPTTGKIFVDGSVCGLFEMGGTGHPHLTGREYARRYFELMGVPRAQRESLLDDVQDFSELEDNFDRPILTYSSGMAARLYFATATARAYDVFLIDELLSVGDEHFQAKCWTRMRKLLLNGASGVLVTHDWGAILRLCEHSHVLERGRIVNSGPSDQMVVKYLGLEMPAGTVARFADTNAENYVASSGCDAAFRFEVELCEAVELAFTYSIEVMRIGTGWEVLMLGTNTFVSASPGRHEIVLEIERLPLVQGEYKLNVALVRYQPHATQAAEIFDARGWTTGNGWKLEVDGESSRTAVALPVNVSAW